MPPRKQPGGQTGNKNALKHGLYAQRTADLKTVALDLKKEIAYLEGLFERVATKLDEAVAHNDPLTEKERDNVYLLLNIVDRRITAVRSQAFISGELSEIEREIEEGLFLARQDLGILDYLTPPQLTRPARKRSRKKL